jgi:Ca2+-binding RTX toxin-like protein
LRGGAGDDAIDGKAGDDTYIYARGDGHDSNHGGPPAAITAPSTRWWLEGLNPSDVSLVRNGNHLTLVIAESTPGAGDGGSVLLNDELDSWFNSGR